MNVRVEFCDEHLSLRCLDINAEFVHCQTYHDLMPGSSRCRMVEMQVAPLDARIVGDSAIVIERDAGWPLWLTEICSQWGLEPQMFLEDLEDAYTETDPSLSNLSDIPPGQRLSGHSPQPERSSTEVSALTLKESSEAP